jgi:hypothetical protein
MRRSILIVSIAIVVAGATWLVARNQRPEIIELSSDDVHSMTGEVHGLDSLLGFTDVPCTNIPSEYIPRIISALQPITVERYPGKWFTKPMGKFVITKRDQSQLEIWFPMCGQNRFHYTVNGRHCYRGGSYEPIYDMVEDDGLRMGWGDESCLLFHAINELHHQVEDGNKRKPIFYEIEELFQDLERSAGKRLPRKP